jgi:sodium-dependent dicarboxylate transporter 2/3/5
MELPSPEINEVLSKGEERFENARRKTGWIVSPLLFFLVLFIPFPGLSPEAHKLAAVMSLVMVLWITEALPLAITGLLGPTLVIALGIAPAPKAFAPFADPIMFLFLGAFVLARAISVHGLDKRFAYRILSLRWVGESPGRILFSYGAVCCFISMWISNTATVAMMFPIGAAIISTLRKTNGNSVSASYAAAMMLICAFAASIGGLATPVGTPTNLIGLGFIERQLGRHVAFIEWMSFGVPIVITLFLLLFLYLYHLCPAGIKKFNGIRDLLLHEHSRLGAITSGERNTLIAFTVTIILWLMPGILTLSFGDGHPLTTSFTRHLPESVSAIIGACLLFLIPVNWKKREFTIDIKTALQIDWGVMAFYGGGIALGQMAFETKLAESAGTSLAGLLPSASSMSIPVFSTIAVLVSEFTSNVASASMVVPVIILLGGTAGLQPALAATMACSLGFMLPISTPTNAIVYSSGYVRLTDMIKYGVLLDIIGIIIIFIGTILFVPTH